jgi:type IV secretion system protein VirD4
MTRHRWVAVTVAAVACAALVGWVTFPVLTVTLLVLCALIAGYSVWWRRRRAGSAALVARWTDRAKRHHGVANFWAILRVSSWWAMRRRATVLRPSLNGQTWWARWRRTPITELGTRVIRSGWLWVWSSVEEHTLTLGGPRQGKSGKLAGTIVDAPGAVLVTSTGGDLVRNTAHLRTGLGPVHVFNPSNVGGLASTVGFNVLGGCHDPRTAGERAADLLSATPLAQGHKDAEWVERATEALAALMHAAALGGATMHHVQRWVADPDGAINEVLSYLRMSPETATAYQAMQFFNLGRPRSSVCMSITPALRWLTDPVAVACASTGSFDVGEFLEQRATIYLLAEKDGPVAPLVTALAGHIARSARRVADQQSHERLEPALTLVLDEAPSICPLPLPAWTADMGKRNITMHIGAQSLSQLHDRWGEKSAGTLLTNCATIMVFGGTKDPAGLSTFSTLAGGLLTPSQVQQLLPLHAVVFRNGMLPVVGRPQMVWQRRDYRMAATAAVWQPRLARLAGLCKTLSPRRRAVTAQAPAYERLALPAGGTAQREYTTILEETGLSR